MSRSSNSPRYDAPAINDPMSSAITRRFCWAYTRTQSHVQTGGHTQMQTQQTQQRQITKRQALSHSYVHDRHPAETHRTLELQGINKILVGMRHDCLHICDVRAEGREGGGVSTCGAYLEAFGHISGDDALCESLHDRRLAHARLQAPQVERSRGMQRGCLLVDHKKETQPSFAM